MFKKASLLAAALALNAMAMPAFSATTTANVAVAATLTPACTVSASNPSLTYTSFQGTDATDTKALTIKCTTASAYTVSLGTSSGTLLGLNYSLALVKSSDGTAATGGNGTGVDDTSISVKATIASGQSGTSAGGLTGSSSAHVVTVSY